MKLPWFSEDVDYHKLVERAYSEAQAGRQLAIYDAETGLFAPWFLGLRCPEECYRAVRYGRPLSLLLIEVNGTGKARETAMQQVVLHLKEGRRSDIPVYLGTGHFAVLLPETDPDGAAVVASRVESLATGIAVAVSSHPYDGGNLEQLLLAAKRRAGDDQESLAA